MTVRFGWLAGVLLLGDVLACSKPAAVLTGEGTSGGAPASSSGTTGVGAMASSSGGTTGGVMASSSGTTSGGLFPTFGNPVALLDAGEGENFGNLSLASAGSQAELFFAVAVNAGYSFRLQHLAPSGAAIGDAFEFATGTPESSPEVTVASDGELVAACWEDSAVNPWISSYGCPEAGPTVDCRALPLAGPARAPLVDGGFSLCGVEPKIVSGAGGMVVSFVLFSLCSIPLDFGGGIAGVGVCGVAGYTGSGPTLPRLAITNLDEHYYTVFSFGAEFDYFDYSQSPSIELVHEIPGIADAGERAIAASENTLGLAIREDLLVSALTLSIDAGSTLRVVTLSSADEQPLGPLAAAACASSFGYAYAVDGGNVMFRETSFDGALSSTESTLIANLGANAQSLALTATDGGLLLAVGTSGLIGLYLVSCP